MGIAEEIWQHFGPSLAGMQTAAQYLMIWRPVQIKTSKTPHSTCDPSVTRMQLPKTYVVGLFEQERYSALAGGYG